MRVYLDPHTYMYEQNEWIDYSFTNRLLALTDFMIRIKEFEESTGIERKLLNFQSSQQEMLSLYETNPFINEPQMPAQYVSQYRNVVFPELTRRLECCPGTECEGPAGVQVPLPTARDPADRLAVEFAQNRYNCCICGNNKISCLIKHSDRESIDPNSQFFNLMLEMGNKLEIGTIDPVLLFPDPNNIETREVNLRVALEVERLRAGIFDSRWLNTNINNFVLLDSFWRSLEAADFRDLAYTYKSRILNTLLQIITGQCTTSNMHRMKTQTIKYNSSVLNRWNAYVFQSGASDQDRRCSRIYYGNSSSGVVLETYDPDAH